MSHTKNLVIQFRPVLRKNVALFLNLWWSCFIKLKIKRDAMNALLSKLLSIRSNCKLYSKLFFWLLITFCKIWIRKHFFESMWIISKTGIRVILVKLAKLVSLQLHLLETTIINWMFSFNLKFFIRNNVYWLLLLETCKEWLLFFDVTQLMISHHHLLYII